MKNSIFRTVIIMAVSAIILFCIMLPAINIHDIHFWLYLLILAGEFILLRTGSIINKKIADSMPRKGKAKVEVVKEAKPKSEFASLGKFVKFVLILFVAGLLYIFLSGIFYSPVLNAKRYAQRIQVTNVDFSEVPPYSFNQTAIIDRDSSEILGNKVMGEMTDLVSQFQVSNEYSQVSYKNGTYRVTPLAYDGFVKYLRNRSEGIPGYIIVNTTTGETKLQRITNKMHYVPSAYFLENLMIKLRFSHPFTIFGNPSFEIDEDGNPYYVCTTYTYSGVNSLRRVEGVILFDPVTGTSTKYAIEDAPTWVDRIYPESLVNRELNDWGKYQKGYFNTLFAQEGVIQTSEGYNYISKDGDIWLYTGMTSVANDSSNVGFALVNLRHHEAQFISTSGADEYSVMASAEGEVLNYGYTATFPVLVNINDQPVYLLSLKDSAGLIKMYAMVDAKDYQQVYTVKAEKDARSAINDLIAQLSGSGYIEGDLTEKTITIEEIREVIISGNTVYYIKAGGTVYKLPLTESNAMAAVFLKEVDTVKIYYSEIDNEKVIQTLE